MKSYQGTNARKVNCSCVYSAYILKPVLSGQNSCYRVKALTWIYMFLKLFDDISDLIVLLYCRTQIPCNIRDQCICNYIYLACLSICLIVSLFVTYERHNDCTD